MFTDITNIVVIPLKEGTKDKKTERTFFQLPLVQSYLCTMHLPHPTNAVA
jgi:hypothetical protein